MKEVLSYHVYSDRNGGMWLSDEEHTWTSRFLESASFDNAEIAHAIAERETNSDKETFYVFACMGL